MGIPLHSDIIRQVDYHVAYDPLKGALMKRISIVVIVLFLILLGGCASNKLTDDLTSLKTEVAAMKTKVDANAVSIEALTSLLKSTRDQFIGYNPNEFQSAGAFCCDYGFEYYDKLKDETLITPLKMNFRITFKGQLPTSIVFEDFGDSVEVYHVAVSSGVTRTFLMSFEAISKFAMENAGIKEYALDLGEGMALIIVKADAKTMSGDLLTAYNLITSTQFKLALAR